MVVFVFVLVLSERGGTQVVITIPISEEEDFYAKP
jgi:hypothetical protein